MKFFKGQKKDNKKDNKQDNKQEQRLSKKKKHIWITAFFSVALAMFGLSGKNLSISDTSSQNGYDITEDWFDDYNPNNPLELIISDDFLDKYRRMIEQQESESILGDKISIESSINEGISEIDDVYQQCSMLNENAVTLANAVAGYQEQSISLLNSIEEKSILTNESLSELIANDDTPLAQEILGDSINQKVVQSWINSKSKREGRANPTIVEYLVQQGTYTEEQARIAFRKIQKLQNGYEDSIGQHIKGTTELISEIGQSLNEAKDCYSKIQTLKNKIKSDFNKLQHVERKAASYKEKINGILTELDSNRTISKERYKEVIKNIQEYKNQLDVYLEQENEIEKGILKRKEGLREYLEHINSCRDIINSNYQELKTDEKLARDSFEDINYQNSNNTNVTFINNCVKDASNYVEIPLDSPIVYISPNVVGCHRNTDAGQWIRSIKVGDLICVNGILIRINKTFRTEKSEEYFDLLTDYGIEEYLNFKTCDGTKNQPSSEVTQDIWQAGWILSDHQRQSLYNEVLENRGVIYTLRKGDCEWRISVPYGVYRGYNNQSINEYIRNEFRKAGVPQSDIDAGYPAETYNEQSEDYHETANNDNQIQTLVEDSER